MGGAGGGEVILGVTQTSTPHPSTAALEDYSLTNLKKTRLDTVAGVGLSALGGTPLSMDRNHDNREPTWCACRFQTSGMFNSFLPNRHIKG